MASTAEPRTASEHLAAIADGLEMGPTDAHRDVDTLMFLDDLSAMLERLRTTERTDAAICGLYEDIRQRRSQLNRALGGQPLKGLHAAGFSYDLSRTINVNANA